MEQLFDIHKVGKSGVKFDAKKLEYLNQQHIKHLFTYYQSQEDLEDCIKMWRQVLLTTLPEHLHSKIRSMSDAKTTMVMDMMKSRIRFYADLKAHTYFFEEPTYQQAASTKFLKKLKRDNDEKIDILNDLI